MIYRPRYHYSTWAPKNISYVASTYGHSKSRCSVNKLRLQIRTTSIKKALTATVRMLLRGRGCDVQIECMDGGPYYTVYSRYDVPSGPFRCWSGSTGPCHLSSPNKTDEAQPVDVGFGRFLKCELGSSSTNGSSSQTTSKGGQPTRLQRLTGMC